MPRKYVLQSHFNADQKFRIDYEKELTEEQLPVVTSKGGPMLVIAGAGSGKTRTVTYRVAFLVESGVPLDSILLVTFTNKAAKEMVSRAELLLGHDIKGLWGGTFHHIANRFLRRHAKLIGFNPNYNILDRADSKDLVGACVGEANIDVKAKKFPKADALLSIFGLAINTGRAVADVIAYNYAQFEPLTLDIEKIHELYQARKKRNNLMDFDDLLFYWWRLLSENDEVAQNYSRKFLHVMVDEYQDTNYLQARIVNILASHHKNIMVVGDDSQSIYSFRGAHFKNIINFPSVYPDAKIYKLQINHRSTPEILDLANETINQAKERFDKTLLANRQTGDKPALISVSTVYEQAAFIAQRMLELREEGLSLNEMAVLYRSHYQSMEIQMELTKRGIPFEVRSGIRFFEEAHIKDVLAYLKILHNPYDEVSWSRVLKLLDRVGPATAEKIFQYIIKNAKPLEEIFSDGVLTVVPQGAESAFKSFQALLRQLKELEDKPAEMIKVIAASEYAEYLKAQYPNYRDRLEDLEQLGTYSIQFKNLEELLSSLALVSGLESETIASGGEPGDKEACVLSTVHQAKGLEWEVVFVVWLADGRFPSYLSFGKDEEMEEERRLFYVAVTRAKDQLYLSYPLVYSGYEGQVLMKPSRYIEDVPDNLFEHWEVEEARPAEEVEIDISDYHESKVKSRDDGFEAVSLNDLDFMK
ncbi:ATP-dependent DNA helicase [Candidatus Saganbacteria bacterium CG08_land_8_20_14_0_20_45_16]|uniref:DNA 3'-5' helicase n=1 Tax=Candidatus Saganbacteria bacterium CG08_land_8_20_14_0_20_45_16 TaxID=2014293 RepID=A0A2H0XWX4_UNCSA|nr:MAG: ATP-dependent DNA helicase [Candidatus Saganbacteria bacterium CG08_land_8_20_14_0_20_45_16]